MLLEPHAGKLARTVLREKSSTKGADLIECLRSISHFLEFFEMPDDLKIVAVGTSIEFIP